jgi:hypothetical protein
MRWIRRGPAIVAAAVVAAGALLVLGHHPAPAPASPAWFGRLPAERTLVLGPGSGFMIDAYATDTTRQQLSVSDPDLPGDQGSAEIWAYDPGTFDAGSVPRDRLVQFGGHDAWYVSHPTPMLAWRGTSGVWVTVTGAVDRAALVRLARAVRLNPPTPVVGPVGLTWLPAGLSLTYARIGGGTSAETFTARGRRSYDVRLSTYPVTSNEWTNGTLGLGAPGTTVAGHGAWYVEDPRGSQLLLEVRSCGVRVQVSDPGRVPRDALDRMIAGATIGSCDDAGDWPPLLS